MPLISRGNFSVAGGGILTIFHAKDRKLAPNITAKFLMLLLSLVDLKGIRYLHLAK